VCGSVCFDFYKVHAHCDCCEAMHACMCGSVCLGLCKAHADGDCCEAMHACVGVCVLMQKAHGHCDCCEAMHACVGVCVWACARRMLTCDCCEGMHACAFLCVLMKAWCLLTVIAARRCMHVWECVLVCTRRMLTMITATRCMFAYVHVCMCVCSKSALSLLWLKHQDTSLDQLKFDGLAFVMQLFQGWEEDRVSNRLPMFVFVMLLSTFLHSLAQLGCLLHMLVHERGVC